MGTAGGEPARRRLGRATAAQRLGFRQYSREDSERARQARFESSRDHRTRTNRSPVIGLSSTACRTLPEEQLLRPIAGERSLLVRWSREDSKRACRARSESSREYCRKPNRWAAVARPRRRRAGSPSSTIVLSSLSNFSPRLFSFLLASFVHAFYAKPGLGCAVAKIDPPLCL